MNGSVLQLYIACEIHHYFCPKNDILSPFNFSTQKKIFIFFYFLNLYFFYKRVELESQNMLECRFFMKNNGVFHMQYITVVRSKILYEVYGVYGYMCVSARMKDTGGIHEGGIHKCRGACGKANCIYETTRMSNFKRHVRKIRRVHKKKKCPHCGKKVKRVDKHIKRMHPEKYNLKRLSCPFPEDKHVWTFIKDLVQTNNSDDRKKKHRWSEEDRQELEARTDNERHELAIQVYERLKQMGMYDDAGGYIKGGLQTRKFSLYKLSLDRIDNDRPHFVGNKLNNLNFIIAGMNTRCNLVSLLGKKTCAFLRQRSKQPITDAEIQAILEREKRNMQHTTASGKGM